MPWRGDESCMLIGPARRARRPTVDDIRRAMVELQARGVEQLVTPALTRFEAEAFRQAGFDQLEALHLLSCHLGQVTIPSSRPGGPLGGLGRQTGDSVRLKTGRRKHLDAMLEVDSRAFKGFWQFDQLALTEARQATPSQLSRLATTPVPGGQRTIGYAVTGRAGSRGYLQRLAVDPAHEGKGVGSGLVHDAFRWLKRRGAETCLVNTQESNHRALGLYEHLGFRRQPEGLVVLSWDPPQ